MRLACGGGQRAPPPHSQAIPVVRQSRKIRLHWHPVECRIRAVPESRHTGISLNHRNLPVFFLFVASVASAPLHARWWAPADDEQLRHSIQTLVDQRCLDIAVTSWPVPWADLKSIETEDYPAACQSLPATGYVREQMRLDASRGLLQGVRLAGSSDVVLWRDYAGAPREKASATLMLGAGTSRTDFAVSLAAVDSDDDEFRADGSYLAFRLGNWALGAGAVDRWWGPGWQSTLAFSHNARPIPALFLGRLQSTPFESRWLRWLGPWQASAFLGQLDSDRVPADAQLIGMRASFRPLRGLEIGLSRTIQWAGEGRPSDLGTLFDALIGRDNGETSGFGPNEDPSDQMGGVDIRYGTSAGANTLAVYSQLIGEDEAGFLPSNFLAMAGIELGTNIGAGSQQWFVEASNTMAGGWFGNDRPLVAYEHSVYATGFRYKGRNMGSTWERDAEVLAVGFRQYFANRHELGLTLAHASLNQADMLRVASLTPVPPLALAPGKESTGLISARYRLPLPNSRITLATQHATAAVPIAAGRPDRTIVMASWEYRPTGQKGQ